ncbi:hypothetical protein ACRAWF_33640 [Streptomyces sp. L7]
MKERQKSRSSPGVYGRLLAGRRAAVGAVDLVAVEVGHMSVAAEVHRHRRRCVLDLEGLAVAEPVRHDHERLPGPQPVVAAIRLQEQLQHGRTAV